MPGQVSPATPFQTPNHTRTKLSRAAERSLNSAENWTQDALQDSSNLPPLERDFFLLRLAAAWNDVDHSRSESYLTPALQGIKTELKNNQSRNRLASLIPMFSGDVIKVDRQAWNSLMADIPPNFARDAISFEAQEMAGDDNVPGAMELEKRALSLGGSEEDYRTVENLIDTDPTSAAKLFDDVLATAVKQDSNSILLSNLIGRAFEEHKDDDEIRSFYNEDRKQKIVSACVQKISSDNDSGSCFCAWQLEHVQPPLPDLGPLQPALAKCSRFFSENDNPANGPLDNTDDIVRAMNETSDANKRSEVRYRAIRHAADVDKDYGRAIHLSIEMSSEEREYLPAWRIENLEYTAVACAIEGIRAALANNNLFEPERLVNLLPEKLRSQAQLEAVRLLKDKDKDRAVAMLNSARSTLEQAVPAQKADYQTMLIETSDLQPQDVNLAWRVLVSGLNRFNQSKRTKATNTASESQPDEPIWDPMRPWFFREKTIVDEPFVQACVGDLTSAEDRAILRIGVIGTFLVRYSAALKPTLNNSSLGPSSSEIGVRLTAK